MNWFKNLIYNKSDLFIALMIILVAGLLIFFRIQVLMDYPEKVIHDPAAAAPYSQEAGEGGAAAQTDENDTPDGANTTGGAAAPEDTAGNADASGSYPYTLTIEYGQSLSQLAQTLVGLGYFESVQEFNDICKQYGADTKIQSGTFTIPRSATKVEVLSIITKTDLTAQ